MPSKIVLAVLLGLTVVTVACMSPPDKEMNQARGAIQAAKAAGADVYAADEYKAATDSLKKSEDAVQQRDFRQALNFALDSREQAENAAKTAGDQKAIAGSQAERDIRDLQTLLGQARAALKSAEGNKQKRRIVQSARRTVDGAEASVQKAREAMTKQDYIAAHNAMQGVGDSLRAAIREANQAIPAVPARRRK